MRRSLICLACSTLLLHAACGGAEYEDIGDSTGSGTGAGEAGSDGGPLDTTGGGGSAGTSGTGTGGDSTGDDGSFESDGGEDSGGFVALDAQSSGAPPDDGDEPNDEGLEESTDTTTGEPVCDVDAEVTMFLSPDDSNSMSSPVQAREAVLDGWSSLQGVTLRPWEFLNYYTFDFAPAPANELVLETQLWRDPDGPPEQLELLIAVSSESITDAERAPINLTLVLDTSGSMTGAPIDMLKESCRAMAASLRPGDKVSMVTWNTQNAIILGGYEVSGPDDAMLLGKIDELQAGGGTDLNGGLTAGYDLASMVADPDRIDRVVLISDGGANAGVTDIGIIADGAGGQNADGIYLVGVGVGTATSYNDALMDAVTDAGKGASVFIPDEEEAWLLFNDRFVNTLDVAARDVRVRVDLPPGFSWVTFSGEEMSGDPTEVEPQHIAPNDTMAFYQALESCAPELLTADTPLTVSVQYKDALTFAEREIVQEYTFGELLDSASPQLHKAAAVFEYAEALKKVREGEAAAMATAKAFMVLGRAEEALPGDADLAEVRTVLDAL